MGAFDAAFGVSLGETAPSSDLGGRSKYANENFEDEELPELASIDLVHRGSAQSQYSKPVHRASTQSQYTEQVH